MTPSVADLKQLAPKEIFPGFQGRFIHSATMTFAYWEIAEGSQVPVHSHPHEQVVNMLEGTLELTVAGENHRLSPGQVLVIPSHAIHSGKALTRCKVLDVFNPVREDYR
jgi:quercetin dioxygenase-like cupin family protein